VSRLQIHIGGTLDDTRRRLLDTAGRFERGEAVEEHHPTFENGATFARLVTARRLELLHHVHRHPARSIRAGLRADYDAIQIAM
jgi:predicted transcriptional regulator